MADPIPAPPAPPPPPSPLPPAPTPIVDNALKVLLAVWAFLRFIVPHLEPAVVAVITTLAMGSGFVGCGAKPVPVPPDPPPLISLPATLNGPVGRAIVIEATTASDEVQWYCDESSDLVVMAGTKRAAFVSPKAGTFRVLAWTSVLDKKDGKVHPTPAAVSMVTVGDVPPGPGPGPTPGPSPLPPGDGFRVLILFPGDPNWKPTSGQLGAMYGADVQAYLRSKCAKGPDGKTPEFRMWPDTVDASQESKVWQDALAKAKPVAAGKLPWVFIGNGDKGASQALPADQAATLKLLQSIGG